jgi:hypothetical protein
MNLEYLLLHIGISHEMVYATKRDLEKIEHYTASDLNIIPPPPPASCSCNCTHNK